MAEEIFIKFATVEGSPDKMFVEVEDSAGKGIKVGPWGAGSGPYVHLGPFYSLGDFKEAEAKIERLIKAGDALWQQTPARHIGAALLDQWEEAKR